MSLCGVHRAEAVMRVAKAPRQAIYTLTTKDHQAAAIAATHHAVDPCDVAADIDGKIISRSPGQ